MTSDGVGADFQPDLFIVNAVRYAQSLRRTFRHSSEGWNPGAAFGTTVGRSSLQRTPPPRSYSISIRRSILPEAFWGMESTNWTWRIYLKEAT